MALTAKMVASEILVCGVKAGIKSIPIVGEMAVNVIDGLQRRHESLGNAAKLAEFDAQLSRVERSMRETVEKEIRGILTNFERPFVPGPELTREMNELRQIYEQGWVPNLFEGLLRNSTHLQELRKNPKTFGRILGDNEPLDPESMHLLVDKDQTRILQMPVSSLALLLGNQSIGVPQAEVKAGQDIWAFPSHSSGLMKGGLSLEERQSMMKRDKIDRNINPERYSRLRRDNLIGDWRDWRASQSSKLIQSLTLKSDGRCVLTTTSGSTTKGTWTLAAQELLLETDNPWALFSTRDVWHIEILDSSPNSISVLVTSRTMKDIKDHPCEQVLVKVDA
jgi:hypothetical protein